ncbi:MAG TPA: haloacid dehalogenase type II [Candidatus Limnocylindria bacterium]|jgi:2-haloacid dehalogenase
MTAPKVVAFDVNETLLDLRALDPHFVRMFGDATVRPLWFTQMLQLAFIGTITGEYIHFTAAQRRALRMIATRRGVTLADADSAAIADQMTQLPAHGDVVPALEALGRTGATIVALTNSPSAVAEAQLRNAEIRGRFAQVLSADTVRRLKPAPEPYQMAAERTGVAPGELMLVAAHGWDISGALAAGCRAAFVARPGALLDPEGPQPEIVASGLAAVVEGIIALF